MARRDYVHSNKAAGTLMILGAACVAVGALLPWIALQTVNVHVDWRVLRLDFAPKHSVGGLHDGGWVLLALSCVVALCAIFTLWSSRGRALICRLLALILGVGFAALAAYIIVDPSKNYADVLVTGNIFDATSTVSVTVGDGDTESTEDADPASGVAKGLDRLSSLQTIHIDVQPGTYVLLIGGGLIAFGAIFPGTRSSKQSTPMTYPVSPSA
ncbi:hypothetical protein ACPPVT_14295 [Angustibacter sp. McL0619]|uniref:hypothetical protein n=1 Tax=Angustibacter sp. McL0619 TaxID=3415676 RepID=UPI003CE9E828